MNTTTQEALIFNGSRARVLARMYGVGVLFGLVVGPVIRWAASAVLGEPPTNPVTLSIVFMAVLLMPPIEEFLFRYVPFYLFDNRPRLAIWLGAIAFGVVHLLAHPVVAVHAFVVGLMLGWVYSRSRDLWHPIAMHSGINSGALLLGLFLGGVAG